MVELGVSSEKGTETSTKPVIPQSSMAEGSGAGTGSAAGEKSPECNFDILVPQGVNQRVQRGCDDIVKHLNNRIQPGTRSRSEIHKNHGAIHQDDRCQVGTAGREGSAPAFRGSDFQDGDHNTSVRSENEKKTCERNDTNIGKTHSSC